MNSAQRLGLLILVFVLETAYGANTVLIEQTDNEPLLGIGYDPGNRDLLKKCVKTDGEHVQKSVNATKFNANYIQKSSVSALESQFRGEFSGDINLGIIAGYGKYEQQIDHSITGSRDSLSINILYNGPTHYIKNYELNQQGRAALNESDTRFRQVCGEHVISGVKQGLSIRLTATLQFKNKKEYEFTKKVIGTSALFGLIKKEKKNTKIIDRLGIKARLTIKLLNNGFESNYLKQLLNRESLEKNMSFSCELEMVDECVDKFTDLLAYFTHASNGRSVFIDISEQDYQPLHYIVESYQDSGVFLNTEFTGNNIVYKNAIPLSELNALLQQLVYRKIYYISNNQLQVTDPNFSTNMEQFNVLHQQLKAMINYCSTIIQDCQLKTENIRLSIYAHYANIETL